VRQLFYMGSIRVAQPYFQLARAIGHERQLLSVGRRLWAFGAALDRDDQLSRLGAILAARQSRLPDAWYSRGLQSRGKMFAAFFGFLSDLQLLWLLNFQSLDSHGIGFDVQFFLVPFPCFVLRVFPCFVRHHADDAEEEQCEDSRGIAQNGSRATARAAAKAGTKRWGLAQKCFAADQVAFCRRLEGKWYLG
jgi:hypothetical protein